MRPPMRWAIVSFLFLAVLATRCRESKTLHVATTTSVEASGLLDRLVPAFGKQSSLKLLVVAVGTGQALKLLERGDAGAAITHDPEQEKTLVDRAGVKRTEI